MIFRKSKFLFTIIFFLTFFQSSYSNELIIPKKKPSFKSKLIIPPIKPGTVIEKQSLKNDKDLPKEIFGILLPPKNKKSQSFGSCFKHTFIFSYNDSSKINKVLRDRITEVKTDGFKLNEKIKLFNNYLLFFCF